MITLTALERDVVIVASAISAGIHAALTPDHLAEGAGRAPASPPPPSYSRASSSD